MELSEWPELELMALARVYIRRKKLRKAEPIRAELERRLAEAEHPGFRLVYEQLHQKNARTLKSTVIGLFRRAS